MSKQHDRYVDICVGTFMLLGLLALLIMVMKVSGISDWLDKNSYPVVAEFTDIGGLKIRAPVTYAQSKLCRLRYQPRLVQSHCRNRPRLALLGSDPTSDPKSVPIPVPGSDPGQTTM